MPAAGDLPASIAALAGLHAVLIEEAHFERDAEALAEVLETRPGPAPAPAPRRAGDL
jgi:hypothetical protein